MVSKEEIHKELDLIQDVIKRMASNSFEVKKWLIGILTALVVFNHEELLGGNWNFILVLLLPIVSFWILDAYFLWQERLFRNLYGWAVENRPANNSHIFYDLRLTNRSIDIGTTNSPNLVQINKSSNFWSATFSITLWPFYIIPTLIVVGLYILPPKPKPVTESKHLKVELYGKDCICKHCSRGQEGHHSCTPGLEKAKQDSTH